MSDNHNWAEPVAIFWAVVFGVVFEVSKHVFKRFVWPHRSAIIATVAGLAIPAALLGTPVAGLMTMAGLEITSHNPVISNHHFNGGTSLGYAHNPVADATVLATLFAILSSPVGIAFLVTLCIGLALPRIVVRSTS